MKPVAVGSDPKCKVSINIWAINRIVFVICEMFDFVPKRKEKIFVVGGVSFP